MRSRGRLSCRLAGVSLLLPMALGAQVWEVDNLCLELPEAQEYADLGAALAIGDFDGDGLNDVAAGAVGWNSPTVADGGWMVFWGASDRALASAGEVFGLGAVGPFETGGALAAGDFDGDGRDELAVGASGAMVSSQYAAGLVAIAKYDVELEEWPSPTLRISQEDVPGHTPEGADTFGLALAAGDFDGDGYRDLAVGVPQESWPGYDERGLVHVFYGDPLEILLGGATVDSVNPVLLATAGFFGRALAAGDFDGDGYDDLAVGAPYRHVGGLADAGAVEVFYGSVSGITLAGRQTFVGGDFPNGATSPDASFGWALAVGDFDQAPAQCGVVAPCFDDLAIGVPDQGLSDHREVGKVVVAWGGGSGLSAASGRTIRPSSVGADELAGLRFGFALAAGRIDPDPLLRDALAIGAPYEDWGDADDGGVFLVAFPAIQDNPLGHLHLVQRSGLCVSPPAASEGFGFRLAIGDLDGDGWGDLAVDAIENGEHHEGAVQVLFGALFADGFESGGDGGWD